MRRWIVVFVVMGLVSAACADGSSSNDTTPSTKESTVTSAAAEPTSTVPTNASTTGAESAWPAGDVLVTNDDGVFLIDSTGDVTRLVKGRVAYAVDDTRGGLLFQVERGRSSVWASWQFGDHFRDTRVWWVPRGGRAARALLVPTPDAGQDLRLYDAYESEDGHLMVVYVRMTTPSGDESFWTITDSLRVFDVETGVVTELWDQGAYEEGFDRVSFGAGLIAATGYEMVNWCFFLDPSAAIRPGYSPTAWDDITVEVPGVPAIDFRCLVTCCPSGCVLSPDGDWLAYSGCGDVTVVDRSTGVEHRFEFEDVMAGLDLAEGLLLANQGAEMAVEDDADAIVVDLQSASRLSCPVRGFARFATSPVVIGATVVPPTPAAIQLRAGGLGVVAFEDAIGEVDDAMATVMGSPPTEPWEWASWVEYVGWHEYGLYLGFSTPEWPGWDGTSRLIGWQYSLQWPDQYVEPHLRLRTLDDVTIGTTVKDLALLYRDTLALPDEPDGCLGWVLALPDGVMAVLDGPPTDDAHIMHLFWGVGVGC